MRQRRREDRRIGEHHRGGKSSGDGGFECMAGIGDAAASGHFEGRWPVSKSTGKWPRGEARLVESQRPRGTLEHQPVGFFGDVGTLEVDAAVELQRVGVVHRQRQRHRCLAAATDADFTQAIGITLADRRLHQEREHLRPGSGALRGQ
ncbi:MAG: hypothetical protein U1F23_01835 [Lysobacterales bacterium]